ncbi:hypothetical protein IWZ03DRAFT_432936 [Phyllosticta citriasiana]|uniref:Helicase C-terminal domain-containing protein n=1 Tax=Phyllosticta citriasiana TaxID=595635 RepID=A0ABR1KAD1_9PEZI
MHNRDKAYEAFNDLENPTHVMTVNTNLGCGAFEVQRACHVTVLLDIPATSSPRLFDQLIGRTWRMGQKHSPNFIIIATLASYDHIKQGDFFLKAIVQAAILGNIPTRLELVVDDAAEHLEDAAEHREDATENREDAAENQQDAAAAQAEGNADAGDDVRKDHKAFLTRAMRLVIGAYGLSSSRLGWDRASCELLLAQQREHPNLTRADSVIEPEVEEAAGQSSNNPLVVDDDDDSDMSSGEQQDAKEDPGEGPSTASARGKRAASTELDNPAKRRAMGDEASSSE